MFYEHGFTIFGQKNNPINESDVIVFSVPYEKYTSDSRGVLGGPLAVYNASFKIDLLDEITRQNPFENLALHQSVFSEDRSFMHRSSDYPETILNNLIKDMSEKFGKWKNPSKNRVISRNSEERFFTPFFIGIGGEHTVTYTFLNILKKSNIIKNIKDTTVVSIDSRYNLKDSENILFHDGKNSAFTHGCVMRRVHELGYKLMFIGQRNLSEEELKIIRSSEEDIIDIPYDKLGLLSQERPENRCYDDILNKLKGDVYISIDMSALHTSIAPNVGLPSPNGGLLWSQLMYILKRLFYLGTGRDRCINIIGMDIVEICPIKDQNITEMTAALILKKCLSFLTGDYAHFDNFHRAYKNFL